MWTMPRTTLQAVAALIGLIAIAGLALGFVSAPQRGRLPGESAGGPSSAPINAPDAMPIVDAPPPPPPEKTEEEKAKEEEEEKEETKLVEKAPPPSRMPTPAPELTVPVPPPPEPPPTPEPPSEIPPF